MQNLRFVSSAVPEILGGPKIWKVGHVTRATSTFDQLFIFCLVSLKSNQHGNQFCLSELALRGPLLSFKFQLDWTYCFGDMVVIRFWHFSWKMPIWANFWRFLGILTPKLCYCCSNPKGMQLSQKRAFWSYITRQNWSSGLTPRCAKEQTKKHRPLTFHPFVGVTPWTDWHAIWAMEWRPQRNHPCQMYIYWVGQKTDHF